MTDGQKDTYVELGAQVIDDHFGIDLKAVNRVTDIHLTMGESDEEGKQSYYKEGVLEYSADGNTWTQIGTFAGRSTDAGTVTEHELENAVAYKYLRVQVTQPGTGMMTGFGGIRIQGEVEAEAAGGNA